MLPDPTLLLGFVAASLLVLLIPGPGVLYVVARSTTQGTVAGLVSVLGLSAGAFLHVIAAVVGLSALLLASATAFNVVKLLGAGYLIYLGVRMILDRAPVSGPGALSKVPYGRLFADGVIVSIFNPKIAIFFLAYLPQFVSPAGGAVAAQILMLGLIYCGLAILTDGAYALAAGGLRRWLGRVVSRARWPRVLGGSMFIALGIQAAIAGRPR